jgi:hypothetical protein
MSEENGVLEFEGHYLGGHVDFPDRWPVILQLSDENLFVALYAPGQCLGPPFLSIPYANISNVQNAPNESAVPGLICLKGENYLTLSFRDELDMEQTVVFKIKKTDKAPSAIYDKVVEAKKNKKLE